MKLPFRFSLLNLFLITTIIALALVAYLTQSRLRLAEAELSNMRDQFGHLTIDDPTRLHVIAVPVPGTHTYRWRIHLPGGHDFRLYSYKGEVSTSGRNYLPLAVKSPFVNASALGGQNDPMADREIVIDAVLEKKVDGQFHLNVVQDGEALGAGPYFGESPPKWSENWGMGIEQRGGLDGTVVCDVEQPCKLLVLGAVRGDKTSDDSVVLWIDTRADPKAALQKLLESN